MCERDCAFQRCKKQLPVRYRFKLFACQYPSEAADVTGCFRQLVGGAGQAFNAELLVFILQRVQAPNHQDVPRAQGHEVDPAVTGLIVVQIWKNDLVSEITQHRNAAMWRAPRPANRKVAINDAQHAHEMHAAKRHIHRDQFDSESGQQAADLLMGAPSEAEPRQLRELHVRLSLPKE